MAVGALQALPFIMGCGEPLSALTQQLLAAHVSGDTSQPLTEMLLRNVVIDVATRRSYGVKDGEALSAVCQGSGHRARGGKGFGAS